MKELQNMHRSEFYSMISSNEQMISWLMERELLLREVNCDGCGSLLHLVVRREAPKVLFGNVLLVSAESGEDFATGCIWMSI